MKAEAAMKFKYVSLYETITRDSLSLLGAFMIGGLGSMITRSSESNTFAITIDFSRLALVEMAWLVVVAFVAYLRVRHWSRTRTEMIVRMSADPSSARRSDFLLWRRSFGTRD